MDIIIYSIEEHSIDEAEAQIQNGDEISKFERWNCKKERKREGDRTERVFQLEGALGHGDEAGGTSGSA